MTKQRNSRIRAWLHPVAAAVSAALVAGLSIGQARAADDYPSRPVHIVVPFTPGGPNDFMARPVAQALTGIFGKTFLVENKPGADGIIGTAAVASAAPDGYTMLITTGSFLANAVLRKDLPYSPMKSFLPVTQLAESYGLVLVSRPEFPAKNLEELIALTKKNPGKYSFASSGTGGIGHLLMELFKSLTGTYVTHIPYRGAGPALNDVVAGQVPIMFDNLPSTLPFIKDKRLVAIVVSAPQRLAVLPDIPTFKEVGLEPVNRLAYYGICGPKGLPRDIVDKINAAVKKTLEDPTVRKRIEDTGSLIVANTPEQFTRQIAEELAIYKKVVVAQHLILE